MILHEYSIVNALLQRVEGEARSRGATSVKRIAISLGDLSGVDPTLLTSAYDVFREGTLCETAELQIRWVPIEWSCPNCSEPIRAGDPLHCKQCGAAAELRAGDDVMLDQIEMEVP